MRLAYLINQYPKTSHSFVRREIEALEKAGHTIVRYTIRESLDALVDPKDKAEKVKTTVVLNAPFSDFLRALGWAIAQSPIRFCKTFCKAVYIGFANARSPQKHLTYFVEACLAAKHMQSARVQHIHAHFGTNSAAAALYIHGLNGIPFSVTVHGPEEFEAPVRLALKEKIADAAFVAAVSSYGKRKLIDVCGLKDQHKAKVVRCGLDFSDPRLAVTDVSERMTLVHVGRLSEQKGQALLLSAFAEVIEKHPTAELRIIGDGPKRPELEQQIERLGLAANVTLLGWTSEDGVFTELRNARALVLSSIAEGLPVVIMEAFALGRPVITTDVAGIPELVAEGKSGWLVAAGDKDALAEAVDAVLCASTEHLSAMGMEGRQQAERLHDISDQADILANLFAKSINALAPISEESIAPQTPQANELSNKHNS